MWDFYDELLSEFGAQGLGVEEQAAIAAFIGASYAMDFNPLPVIRGKHPGYRLEFIRAEKRPDEGQGYIFLARAGDPWEFDGWVRMGLAGKTEENLK